MGDEKTINHNRPDTGPTFFVMYFMMQQGRNERNTKR